MAVPVLFSVAFVPVLPPHPPHLFPPPPPSPALFAGLPPVMATIPMNTRVRLTTTSNLGQNLWLTAGGVGARPSMAPSDEGNEDQIWTLVPSERASFLMKSNQKMLNRTGGGCTTCTSMVSENARLSNDYLFEISFNPPLADVIVWADRTKLVTPYDREYFTLSTMFNNFGQNQVIVTKNLSFSNPQQRWRAQRV